MLGSHMIGHLGPPPLMYLPHTGHLLCPEEVVPLEELLLEEGLGAENGLVKETRVVVLDVVLVCVARAIIHYPP